jgi:hypothetical protein
MTERLIRCLIGALVGGIAACALWYGIGIAMVWNSHDGQADMGAAIGAMFLGGPLGALLGYGFEHWRSGREV